MVSVASAQIPDEYNANYKIKTNRDKIQSLLVQIEASKKVGNDVAPSVFQNLNSSFSQVFPFFPQQNTYKIVYEQCNQLSKALSTQYEFGKFTSFIDGCFDPLNTILTDIDSKFTVVPNVKVSPNQGAAPLTVTFDSRDSSDPSNDTIPSNNFFRYYKDTDGKDKVIGKGPVINYMFEKEGNYLVHMTARSANQAQGIFDGEKTVAVNVGPQSAIVSIFANGKRLRKGTPLKFGTQEAQRGINFDGTPTLPKGGRKILTNTWEIAGPNNFKFKQDGEGNLWAVRLPLSSNGEYKIKVTIKDNENNTLTEEFSVVVSDPVATIKATPVEWNTSTTFGFDAGASYSIVSSIKQYNREIFDDQGEKVDTLQSKSFKRQFTKPGLYKIKLTVTDELNQSNFDQYTLDVQSADPVPQFLITPLINWKKPSQFILDAGASSDIDVQNGFDTLTYNWKFSSPDFVKIDKNEDNGKKLIVSFNQKGTYKVTLTVVDQYGKQTEISKDIIVESSLRPMVYMNPTATTFGNTINFIVKSDKPLVNYDWNFGDTNTRTLQADRTNYQYQKVWVHNVALIVTSPDGDTNQLTRQVFIWERNSPVAAYQVKDSTNVILLENDTCREITDNGQVVDHEAFRVDRYAPLTIDVSNSVNTKGQNTNLKFFFQPKNEDILAKPFFTYKFSELWCNYIDIVVEDDTVGKNDRRRVWFKVVNALPKLDSLKLFFPQYGNEVGIGFNQGKNKDVFKVDFDPLVVKVNALGALDPDGFVSYYTWYYYDKNDPARILEAKVTPSNIPYVYFSVPSVAGEYMFGVKIVDNDNGEIRSQDLIGNGPVVFFPPDSKNVDIPIVTLKVNQINIKAWDEVRFDTISKILSSRSDFDANRTFRYDFDGDGEYDLTTKDASVTHEYVKDGVYSPRVRVTYRGYSGIGKGEKIQVTKGMKPRFLYQTFDKKVLFKDVSVGSWLVKQFCLDGTQCVKDKTLVKTGVQNFVFDYPGYGTFNTTLTVQDEFGNVATKSQGITLKKLASLGTMELMSIPTSKIENSALTISVGNSLENKVLYYIVYNGQGDCYMDKDVTADSDGDKTPDNDRDIACNTLYEESYSPQFDQQPARIYYEEDQKLLSRDLTVKFVDAQIVLPDSMKVIYNQINKLIISLRSTGTGTDFIKTQLISLRNGLVDKTDTSSAVVTIRDYITTTKPDLTTGQKADLDLILNQLSDKSTSAALGGNAYDNAKNQILSLLKENLRNDVQQIFTQIENAWGDKDKVKPLLEQILKTVGENSQAAGIADGLDDFDLNEINTNICDIVLYFQIPSEKCADPTENVQQVEVDAPAASGLGGVVKTILIILGILVGLFVWLVAVFAIKARLSQNPQS